MIDVIIPAYNAHNTIHKTLLSISFQTIKDKLKVYIVNDGSDEDYSYEINKFSKIIDISEIKISKNMGVGNARDVGLYSSKNESIIFIDADDCFVDCYALENLYNSRGNYDIISGRIFVEEFNHILSSKNAFNVLHGKLYNRNFIIKNKIHFCKLKMYEDSSFNNLLIVLGAKINIIEKDVYFYQFNEKSITKKDYQSYLINSSKIEMDSIKYVVDESIKRNCDIFLLSKFIFEISIIIYFKYLFYYEKNKSDAKKILNSYKKLKKYYNDFAIYIDDETKFKIYNEYYNISYDYKYKYDINQIPYISLNDFINLL